MILDDFGENQEASFEMEESPKGLMNNNANLEHALVVNDDFFIVVCLNEILKEEGYMI